MLKVKNINFSEKLVTDLVLEELKKVPGINFKTTPKINIDLNANKIVITFSPVSSIYNVFNLANKIQEAIYHQIKIQFDLEELTVDINATL